MAASNSARASSRRPRCNARRPFLKLVSAELTSTHLPPNCSGGRTLEASMRLPGVSRPWRLSSVPSRDRHPRGETCPPGLQDSDSLFFFGSGGKKEN